MTRRRRQSVRYLLYLRSPLWRLRRRIWIIRAAGRCERCRSRRRLTIHHRTYKRLGHERRADVQVLCWDCHRRHHVEQSQHIDRRRLLDWLRPPSRARVVTPGIGRDPVRLFALVSVVALPILVALALLAAAR